MTRSSPRACEASMRMMVTIRSVVRIAYASTTGRSVIG
jgi:hypothetical protein